MKLNIFLAFFFSVLVGSAATLPVSMNTTNGQAKGVTTIGGNLVATNNSGSNYFAGALNVRSNISTTGRFNGNAVGVSNAVDLIPGSMIAITTNSPRMFTISAVGFIAGIAAGSNITITTNSPESLTIASSGGGSSSTNYILDLNGNGTNTSFQGPTTVGGRLLATNTIAGGGSNYIAGLLSIGDFNFLTPGQSKLTIKSTVTNPPASFYQAYSSLAVGHTVVNSNFLHHGIVSLAMVASNNTADWTNSSYSQLNGVSSTVLPQSGSSGSIRKAAGFSSIVSGVSPAGTGAWFDEAVMFLGDPANSGFNYLLGAKFTGLNQGTNNTGVYLGISQSGYPFTGNWGFVNETTYPSYFGGHVALGSTNATDTTNNLSIVSGTLGTNAKAINVTGTLASSASLEIGTLTTITGSGSGANQNTAARVVLAAGYTGSSVNIAISGLNQSAGTGTGAWTGASGNDGASIASTASTSGNNVGGFFGANNSSSLNLGVFGRSVFANAGGSALNVGVAGTALNATNNVGGFFGLMSTAPTLTSAALMADNGATGSPIIVGRNTNGSVFSVDGSGVINGNASGVSNAVDLIPGSNVTITTNGPRTFTIASSGGGSVNLIPGSHIAITTNNPSTFTISSFDFIAGISAGANITIVTNSPESLTISSSGGGGGTTYTNTTDLAGVVSSGGIGTNFPACALAVNTAFDGAFLSPTNSGANRIWTQDAITLTNYAASNVVSGGVLPMGTVSASTSTAGYVLATTGSLRNWTNRVSLSQIDGIGGIGSTNVVTGRIVSTNVNVANTSLTLNGAQNGAGGNVLDYSSNNVSKINVTTDGDLTIAGTNRVVKLRVGGAAESGDAINVTGTILSSSTITAASMGTVGSINVGSASGTTFFWSSRSALWSPVDGIVSVTANNGITGAKLLLGGSSTSANLAGSTNWPMLVPWSKTNGPGYVLVQFMSGTNTTETVSIAADMVMSTNKFTGAVAITTNGNFAATGYMNPTNGILWQGGAQLTNIYTATATLDFANLVSIGCEELAVACTGARDGDVVSLGVPSASMTANTMFSGYVASNDYVNVKCCTVVSGDPASGVFRVEVRKWK